MGDYEYTESVNATPDMLFDYLADVHNLPKYFTSMTSAEPGDGESVRTTAVVEGRQVEGEAWFRVSRDERRLEWGSEGPSDYRGELDVTGDGDAARVSVRLHTEQAEGDRVQRGVTETVKTIKRLVEEEGAA